MLKVLLSLTLFIHSNNLMANYIMIGDSIFVHRGQEIKRLVESSQKISIKSYAVTGHWFWEICKQYERSSISEGDVLIMDGGGNDMFGNGPNCRNKPNAYCIDHINKIGDMFSGLLKNALDRKIDVVYFLSPYYTKGFNSVVDYGSLVFKSICDESLVKCIFIDSRSRMSGNVYEWDGVHPNQNGTKILSTLIIEALNAK